MVDVKKVILTNQNGDAEIMLYGIIGRYWDVDTTVIVREIEDLRKQGCKNITFFVNSDGGDVIQGQSLFNYLNRLDINVTWVVDGVAASMMSMLLCNPAHKVKSAKYAKFMYHRIQGTISGNPDEVRSGADMMESFEKDLIEMMAVRMKSTYEKCKKKYFTDGLDHWLSAEEAVKLGLCDEIIEGRMNIPAPTTITDARDLFNYYNNQIINFNKNSESIMKHAKIYAQLLGMPETDNEDVLLEKVQNIVNENATVRAQLQTANAEKTQLENEVKAQKSAKVKNLIDTAIAEKKFGEDERQSYTELAEANFELANKVIGKMSGVSNPANQLYKQDELPEHIKGKSWDDLHKSGQLENVKKNYPEHFESLRKVKFNNL